MFISGDDESGESGAPVAAAAPWPSGVSGMSVQGEPQEADDGAMSRERAPRGGVQTAAAEDAPRRLAECDLRHNGPLEAECPRAVVRYRQPGASGIHILSANPNPFSKFLKFDVNW